jgi:hypothetical protein
MLGPPETAAFLLFLLFLFSRADLIRMLRQGRRRAFGIIRNTPHETIRIFPNARRVIGRVQTYFLEQNRSSLV